MSTSAAPHSVEIPPFAPGESSPVLLTPRAAAARLGISERKLRDITVPHGDLPRVPIGRAVRYRTASLEAWAVSHEERGPGE